MSDEPSPKTEIILYQTEDGRTRIQCRFEQENVWMTQALMAELFQVTVPTVNEHLKGIYAEGELPAVATIRKFRIVRLEGARQVTHEAALAKAEAEYEKFRALEDARPSPVEKHFQEAIEQTKQLEAGKSRKRKKP
jgi:hypothetical protein